MKAFIFSQFGYCPLVWMLHSRRLNNRINNVYERAVQIVYRVRITSFEELLKKNKSVTIHQINLQILAIEIFKTKNGLNLEIMKKIPNFIEPAYHLRSNNWLERHNVKSVRYRIETISHIDAKI